MLGIIKALSYLLVIKLVQCRQMNDIKSWIRDTNFDNPQNWESGSLPCENDRVIFPAAGSVVSLLTSSLAVSELILPLDGQLVFANDAQLTLTGGVKGSSCDAKDVRFVVPNHNWYDPENWNLSTWSSFPFKFSSSSGGVSAIPHAYRVPCRTDHVIFPPGKSFKAHVEGSPTVASLSINNVFYNNEEIANFLVSQTGNFLFPGNPKITINGNGCSEIKGCTCGNDEPQIMERICRNNPKCTPTQCSDPVQPVGHCCKICGSLLVMEYDTRFKLETLLDLHQGYLGQREFREVLSYSVRTYEDKIQTIFLDGGETKGKADDVAQKVFNSLSHDIDTAKLYKLRSVNLYSSKEWDSVIYGHQKGASAGSVVGILFAVALVIGGVAAAFYIYRKRNISGFSFARFDLNVDKVELQLGTTPHAELEPYESASEERKDGDKAFDNPVYGKASTSQKEQPEPDTSVSNEEFVENPMFMLFPDKPDSDEATS